MVSMGSDVADQADSPAAQQSAAALAIVGAETKTHTVPVDVLVRTVGSLQQIVYLLAAEEERLPIGERFAMTERFREKYTLRCGVPKESSYSIPLSVGLVPSFLAPTVRPLDRTLNLFLLAAQGAWEEVGRLVPHPKYLPRVLAELQAMLPRPGDRWGIRLEVGTRRADVDAGAYRSIRRYLAPEETQDAVMTVTGDLIRVDFYARRVVVRYRPTGCEIPCQCEPAVLDTILQNWESPVQVTGRYVLDHRGHPIRLSAVTRIEPIDLSPMIFDAIEWGGRRLEFDSPLILDVKMDDESGQLYRLEAKDLGIDVFAQTREQLADELAEQVLFLWDAYAQESPEKLTSAARRLREVLLRRIRESNLATREEAR